MDTDYKKCIVRHPQNLKKYGGTINEHIQNIFGSEELTVA